MVNSLAEMHIFLQKRLGRQREKITLQIKVTYISKQLINMGKITRPSEIFWLIVISATTIKHLHL